MSAQRMTLDTQYLRLAGGLRLGAAACASVLRCRSRMRHRRAVGQVQQKDDTFVEEPADKLYNEGLYLMNQRKDRRRRRRSSRKSIASILFRLGAQIAADVGLFLLQCRRL
jgi:hypothetical protein